jgi:peptidylprolyl isomerase
MRRLLLPSLAMLALVAAGCGGGDDGSTSTSAPAAADAGTATVAPAETAPSTAAQAPADPALDSKPEVDEPDGPASKKLKIRDIVEGTGAEAKAGDVVTADYVGVLYKNGKQFDASWDRGQPINFQLGVGQVIPGWDQGIEGMKVGGRRELTIPPDLAYGTEGSPPVIPPNAPLIFVVDLRAVEPAG